MLTVLQGQLSASPGSHVCDLRTVQEVARLAEEINTSLDNIGARRLHTVLERILEQISFDAPDKVRTLVYARKQTCNVPAAA